MRLDTFSTSLAGGLTAAIFNFVIGLIAMWSGWGTTLAGTALNATGSTIQFGDVLAGMIGGFIIFFILGALFSSLYNTLSHRVEVARHA